MSEIEKKQQTPVKRTHDGQLKVNSDSAKKFQDRSSIDMRKLERIASDDLSSIMGNGKTPHKSKKKDKSHEKSGEKKKKSAKKEKSLSTPPPMRIDTYNLNRDDERCYKRKHDQPTTLKLTPSDKENDENVNLIVKESELAVSMEVDDIPVVAEEIVVEETVMEAPPSTNLAGESPDFHISIQSTPHYTEEVVTETIVAFPHCSQTAP